jgi:ribosomal protein S18 acetylase RimI-like enzyme
MGLLSPIVDHDLSLYILTLGVLEGFRGQGIASSLIQAACQRACETR